METTTTNTLTTAAAWRVAIALTIADVRSFVSTIFAWAKVIAAFAYLMTGMMLAVNDSDNFALNVVGVAMIGLLAVYVKRPDNK